MDDLNEQRHSDGQDSSVGGAGEVFVAALLLGLTSFGGPVAHIGYFERAYVRERRWLGSDEFSGLLALCQMAPGPASSQLGCLVGLRRAGWPGALAAWAGFTLPSAILMFAFAVLAPRLTGAGAMAALHGLRLVAVAVVAQAVRSMAKALCPDAVRATIAVAAGGALLVASQPGLQLPVLLAGGLGGVLLCRNVPAPRASPRVAVGPRAGAWALAIFVGLFLALPLAGRAAGHGLAALAAIFYRAGALVFGGGHVVLPLLREALVPSGWLTDGAFLAGYGAAQALPGPLFTFSAYVGATVASPGAGLMMRAIWAVTALTFIFLPGLLIAVAGVAVWNWLGRHALARGGLAGVNAAVVGILGAALYNPIWTSAVFRPRDMAIAAAAFLLLERWRLPPVLVVGLTVCVNLAANWHAG